MSDLFSVPPCQTRVSMMMAHQQSQRCQNNEFFTNRIPGTSKSCPCPSATGLWENVGTRPSRHPQPPGSCVRCNVADPLSFQAHWFTQPYFWNTSNMTTNLHENLSPFSQHDRSNVSLDLDVLDVPSMSPYDRSRHGNFDLHLDFTGSALDPFLGNLRRKGDG